MEAHFGRPTGFDATKFKSSEEQNLTQHLKTISSPVGVLRLVASDTGLVAVLWENDSPTRVRVGETMESPTHPLLIEAARQLDEYFAGARTVFDLELDFVGTEFQESVWSALLAIPFGETRTYQQLATAIGKPTAARAVGAANGRNPISIVVPCHRLVGFNGRLTGFAGGLENKQYLLTLESRQA